MMWTNIKSFIVGLGILFGFSLQAASALTTVNYPVCFKTDSSIFDPSVQVCKGILDRPVNGYYMADPDTCFTPPIASEWPSPTYSLPSGQLLYICIHPNSFTGYTAQCSKKGGPPSQFIITTGGYYVLSAGGGVTSYQGTNMPNSPACP